MNNSCSHRWKHTGKSWSGMNWRSRSTRLDSTWCCSHITIVVIWDEQSTESNLWSQWKFYLSSQCIPVCSKSEHSEWTGCPRFASNYSWNILQVFRVHHTKTAGRKLLSTTTNNFLSELYFVRSYIANVSDVDKLLLPVGRCNKVTGDASDLPCNCSMVAVGITDGIIEPLLTTSTAGYVMLIQRQFMSQTSEQLKLNWVLMNTPGNFVVVQFGT